MLVCVLVHDQILNVSTFDFTFFLNRNVIAIPLFCSCLSFFFSRVSCIARIRAHLFDVSLADPRGTISRSRTDNDRWGTRSGSSCAFVSRRLMRREPDNQLLFLSRVNAIPIDTLISFFLSSSVLMLVSINFVFVFFFLFFYLRTRARNDESNNRRESASRQSHQDIPPHTVQLILSLKYKLNQG